MYGLKLIGQRFMGMSLGIKLLLGIIVLLGLLAVLRPNTYKDFYKMFNKELERQETVSKQVYDDLQKSTDAKLQEYIEKVNEKDAELEYYKNELILEQQRNYRYEKELKAYRNSDFNERFRVFSNTYSPENDR